jgi:hypothetical protein
MKKLLLFFGVLLLSAVGYGQTTINFDDPAKWTAGSAALSSYVIDHTYIDGVFSATGGEALRNTTTTQDGFPGALGTYSWRLKDVSTVDWKITISSGGIDSFSVDIRRWDASPSPNYSLDYSVDGGTSWALVSLINNTTLGNTSNWVTFNGTINSSNTNILIRLKSLGSTERIMIDNFYWTPDSVGNNTPTECNANIEIESILVDACDGSAEGRNEMFRFSVSGGDLDVSGLTADWPGSNSWKGICQNSTTANIVSEINNTITGGGQILEPPVSGIIPEGSSVMFFTNTNFNYSMFDFSDLNYTLYVIFQCPDNLPGHFANYQSSPSPRTLTLSSAGCDSDIVTYDAHEIYNDDGATVDFTINGVPTYSDTGTCSTVPIFSLPVELLFLSGTRTSESSITLNWTTATETNNNYFEVQKLIGDEYQIIDIVNGSGNSNQEINYEYTDNYAGIKVQYYRLRQVDYDGNFEYYGPIAVDAPLNYKYNLIIYPNPTDDKINIRLNYKGIIEKITLTTISGKEIPVGFNIKCDGETNITLATLNIENGTYLIKFSFVEGEYIHKDKIIINK